MGDQLTEFIRRKEQAAKPPIDWQAKRDELVQSVENLYSLVRKMLRKSIESKAVTVRTFDMEVTEDYVGTYTIPALELSVGAERVEFRPKGIMVLGAPKKSVGFSLLASPRRGKDLESDQHRLTAARQVLQIMLPQTNDSDAGTIE
ncbi:MAG TPA: hypothetical protein VN924_22880 [Bryobacteraceae bacterium]|jgi:hypothetical protein|nr:hypothetical protein [Bryobacteraceae bacterium]